MTGSIDIIGVRGVMVRLVYRYQRLKKTCCPHL